MTHPGHHPSTAGGTQKRPLSPPSADDARRQAPRGRRTGGGGRGGEGRLTQAGMGRTGAGHRHPSSCVHVRRRCVSGVSSQQDRWQLGVLFPSAAQKDRQLHRERRRVSVGAPGRVLRARGRRPSGHQRRQHGERRLARHGVDTG